MELIHKAQRRRKPPERGKLPERYAGFWGSMRRRKNWTQEEKEYLEEKWGRVSIDTLARRMKRTKASILNMKNRMGLGAFLESEDYITWNQLMRVIGEGKESGARNESWIRKKGFPVHRKKVGACTFKVVYIDEFWEWAEKHRGIIDFSRIEENILGKEPGWVKDRRRQDSQNARIQKKTAWTPVEDAKLARMLGRQRYTCTEIAEALQRTEGAVVRRISTLGLKDRPVKRDNHTAWADGELAMLGEMAKAGCRYREIAERLGKSEKAVRGKVYAMYLTENLDTVKGMIGQGGWGDGRPERKVKQKNVMSVQERMETEELLGRLASAVHSEFRRKLDETEWGGFFQKDMCVNFGKDCLTTPGCDECLEFVRIKPQNCKMCGKTFYERKENNHCAQCRAMRKRQYARKQYALMGRLGR